MRNEYTQQQALSQVLKNLLKGVNSQPNIYERVRAENQNVREWKDNSQEKTLYSEGKESQKFDSLQRSDKTPDTQICECGHKISYHTEWCLVENCTCMKSKLSLIKDKLPECELK